MNKSFCDRCGKEIPQFQNILFEIKQIISNGKMPVELCEDCSKQLIEWLKVDSGKEK